MPLFAHSQKILSFDKKGKVKRIRFAQGETLVYCLKEEKKARYEQIVHLDDSFFITDARKVYLDDIKYIIDIRRNRAAQLFYQLNIRAGILYFTLDAGNRLINQEYPTVDERNLRVSIPLFISAFVFRYFGWKRFYMKDSRRLQIIDLSPV